MTDVFSDVLRLIRLKSCVYFVRDFWSPWAMRLDGGAVAQFHAVLRGQCVVEAAGERFQGAPGDVFLFPRCEPHVIADAEGRSAVPGQDFMQSLATGAPFFSEGESSTQLLCGHYEYRNDVRHPLIDELPPVVHVKSLENYFSDTLQSVIPTMVRELNAAGPGAAAVIEKLAEILLVQIVRAQVAQGGRRSGVIAGIYDSRLAGAFRLIHESFGQRIALDKLASVAGMSRSAFALRFKTMVGMTPVAYLTLWRMCSAHELLQFDGLSVSQAALRVGYESEIAFSRAFKRHFGESPGSIRRRSLAR